MPRNNSQPLQKWLAQNHCTASGPKIEKIKSREAIPWTNQAFNTKWKFQSRMVFSFRAPLWPQRNKPWDWSFQARMKFQTKNENFKREWFFRAWGNGFFMRPSENDFFSVSGPSGYFLPWRWLWLFWEVLFKDPQKIPFKTSMTWTSPRSFLPFKVILALQAKK